MTTALYILLIVNIITILFIFSLMFSRPMERCIAVPIGKIRRAIQREKLRRQELERMCCALFALPDHKSHYYDKIVSSSSGGYADLEIVQFYFDSGITRNPPGHFNSQDKV